MLIVSIRDGISMFASAILICIMTDVLLKMLLYDVICLLFSFDSQNHTAVLADYFIVQGPKNSRFYCIKFKDDAAVYSVSWMEFRRYVEKRGAVYSYCTITGLLGRKYMRKVPIMTQDIDEEVFTQNCRQYVLRPNRSDYARMRWGIVAGAGLLFVPFGFIYGFALLSGWANRPELHDKILPQFPMAGVVALLGIALAVIGFKKIHTIGKSEMRSGLPQISMDRLPEKQKAYKE